MGNDRRRSIYKHFVVTALRRTIVCAWKKSREHDYESNHGLDLRLVSLAASAHAASGLKLEDIKQIRCESTVSYEEDSPNEKTAAEGVKIFTPGSRKDVKPRAGAFLLAELDRADGEQEANQQFYFSPVKGNKLSFRFIAAWKAHGELKLGADSTATGFINQKSHITELTCTIRTR